MTDPAHDDGKDDQADRAALGEHPLAGAPEAVEFRHMHASLQARMFGEAPATKIGRFTLLRRVGRGGMGTVFEAYDPSLDRRVALKVLRRDRSGAREHERMLREARALARLSHPNVVTVYEVGEIGDDDEVFIAMEFLAGGTLGDWMREHAGTPEAWREVAAMFLAAGRGLAAAHAAGLVHRDFKPANVLLGSDGRPRVSDFGLARPIEDTQPAAEPDEGTAARDDPWASRFDGTPAYMAPEQRRGLGADARSDQFSFCVALYEALFGIRPRVDADVAPRLPDTARSLPRALTEALRRGLDPDPAQRHPTLDALLVALEPEVRRSRARIVAAVGLVGLAGVAIVASRSSESAASDGCARLAAQIDAAWPTAAPAADDSAARLHAAATAHRDAVSAGLALACREGTPSDERLDCLRRSSLQLLTLRTAIEREQVRPNQALEAALQLRDPSFCADPAHHVSEPPLPVDPEQRTSIRDLRDRLAALQVDARLGKEAQTVEAAKAIATSAARIGSKATEAEALFLLAQIDAWAGRGPAGAEGYRAAARAAKAAGYDWFEVQSLIERAGALAHLAGQPDEAAEVLEDARAGLEHLGHPDALERKFDVNEGIVRLATHQPDLAIEALQRAIDAIERREGSGAFALAQPTNVLAAAQGQRGDVDAARASFARVCALIDAHYGRAHPLYARALNNLGAVARDAGDLEQARTTLREALSLMREHVGADHPSVAMTGHNLADVLANLGELDEAHEVAVEAVAVAERAHGVDSPELRWTLVTLADIESRRGDHEAALATLARADGLVIGAWGDDALARMPLLETRASIQTRMGREADARATLQAIPPIAARHDAQVPKSVLDALSPSPTP